MHKYDLVAVGNGWALTRDGSKFFRENTFGVIDVKEYADSLVHSLNYYSNTITPDNINVRDIVEYKHPCNNIVRRAIVVDITKPRSLDDHGCVEIYFLDGNQDFEHISYIGWNEFMTVVEEYN